MWIYSWGWHRLATIRRGWITVRTATSDRYTDYWHGYAFRRFVGVGRNAQNGADQTCCRASKSLTVANFPGGSCKVRGDLRTYKIHLGSSNILMEPNDQYLCIVPGRGETCRNRRFVFTV